MSLLLVLPLSLSAKEQAKVNLKGIQHPLKPMLWKIEGKGLKKASYLFGTIHLSDARVARLHPLAQKAFDQADALYTEIDLSPEQQMKALPFYMRKDNKTLEQILGKDIVDNLDAELKTINPALNTQPFEKFQIWAVTFMLPQLGSQLNGKLSLDMLLWQRAGKAGKKTGSLETLQDQLGKFDQFTLAEQKELLVTTLKVLKLGREKGESPYQSILNGYLRGDREALAKEMEKDSYMGLKLDPELQKKFVSLLLNKRNQGMADTIQKVLSNQDSGSCFFAAGTLHYIGAESVNTLLTEAGYQVTLVTE